MHLKRTWIRRVRLFYSSLMLDVSFTDTNLSFVDQMNCKKANEDCIQLGRLVNMDEAVIT